MNEDENYLICKHCGVKLSKTAVVCYECKHLTSGEERPKRKKGFFSHLLGRVEKTEATRVKKGTAPTQQGLTAGEWNDKGLALAKSGRNQEAIQYFDKALELDPKNVGALVNKGTALYKLNRYQEALQCCYRALAIDPKNAKAQRLKTAELGKITTPQKEMAKNTTKTKVGKRAYLIFLYSTVPWPANEMARLQRSIQQDEGCPVKTLGAVRVTGPFPTSPDTYVVATGLIACEKIGESWGSTPDIGYRPGGGVGLITVMLDGKIKLP